jgi:hypothetical protein
MDSQWSVSGYLVFVVGFICAAAAADSYFRGQDRWQLRVAPAFTVFLIGAVGLSQDNEFAPLPKSMLDLAGILALVTIVMTIQGYWKWGPTAFDESGTPPVFAVPQLPTRLFRSIGRRPIAKSVSPVFLILSASTIWTCLATIRNQDAGAFGAHYAFIFSAAVSIPGIRMLQVGLRYHRELITHRELTHPQVWNRLVPLALMAFAVLFSLIWLIALELGSSQGQIRMSIPELLFGVLLGAAIVLGMTLFSVKTATASSFAIAMGAAGCLVVATAPWWASGIDPLRDDMLLSWESVLRSAITLYCAGGLSYFTFRSVRANALRLQLFGEETVVERLLMLSAALAVFSLSAWTFEFGLWSINVNAPLLFMVYIAIPLFSILFVPLAAQAIFVRRWHHSADGKPRTTQAPLNNSIQDFLLFPILTIASYAIFRFLSGLAINIDEGLATVGVILGLGLPIVLERAHTIITSNNTTHIQMQTERVAKLDWLQLEKDQFLRELNSWIDEQNRLSYVICPTIPILKWWSNCNDNDENQTWKHIVDPSNQDNDAILTLGAAKNTIRDEA